MIWKVNITIMIYVCNVMLFFSPLSSVNQISEWLVCDFKTEVQLSNHTETSTWDYMYDQLTGVY